ncbi:MAG TPA: hypothetical protein VGC30_00995 [Dokdonella sp.]
MTERNVPAPPSSAQLVTGRTLPPRGAASAIENAAGGCAARADSENPDVTVSDSAIAAPSARRFACKRYARRRSEACIPAPWSSLRQIDYAGRFIQCNAETGAMRIHRRTARAVGRKAHSGCAPVAMPRFKYVG